MGNCGTLHRDRYVQHFMHLMFTVVEHYDDKLTKLILCFLPKEKFSCNNPSVSIVSIEDWATKQIFEFSKTVESTLLIYITFPTMKRKRVSEERLLFTLILYEEFIKESWIQEKYLLLLCTQIEDSESFQKLTVALEIKKIHCT